MNIRKLVILAISIWLCLFIIDDVIVYGIAYLCYGIVSIFGYDGSFATFFPLFIRVCVKGLQLLLSLSILVALHELGHYLAARYFKTRVEKFYLFMNPGFSLFKKQIGETEWGIGWLPLGGYVKISGMIDESMDTDQMSKPPQPWEFRSKPAWQRLIIMLGGIIMNLLVGFLIYSMVLMVWGEKVLPNEYSVNVDPRLEQFGFQSGDQIIEYNGEELATYQDLRRRAFSEQVMSATVIRGGSKQLITLDTELGQILIDDSIRNPFSLMMPSEIDSIIPGSKAEEAGLKPGDRIMEVDGFETGYQAITKNKIEDKKSAPILLTVNRFGETLVIPAMTDNAGHLGFFFNTPEFETIEYGFFESIVGGFKLASNTLRDYVVSLRFLASKSGAKQVGSLITFGNIFDSSWNWLVFWRNTALLSLILAFMNLLPIPALDGGHVMFLLYEMIAGKPAPDKVLEYAQVIGIIFLLMLMVLALGNDFLRLFREGFG